MTTKFSQFAAATTLTGAEQPVGLQGGNNVTFTLAQYVTYFQEQPWAANFLPDADATRSLGSATERWTNGYFATQLYVGASNTPVLNSDGGVGRIVKTPAETTAGVTPTDYSKSANPESVLRFGADPTGVADSLAAFNAAQSVGIDYVLVPAGTYYLSANPAAGMWNIASGATFTGPGVLSGQIIQRQGMNSNYTLRIISNAQTTAQLIPLNFELGFYQTASPNAADQFGQTTECWTPAGGSVVWNGELVGTYGSFSHFGSGSLNALYGGSFEGFNSGSATATLIVGVNASANNGGVAAGDPTQTPTNNGAATNLRAVTGLCNNKSSGVVAAAAALYADGPHNTGGGTITNCYGVFVEDQTAGLTNYAIKTGAGLVSFGDLMALRKLVTAGLPAASAANEGYAALVTDATTPTIGAPLVGGGAAWAIAVSTGTQWVTV